MAPLTTQELDHYLELVASNRAELWQEVRPLTPTMRNWRPVTGQPTINEILHHIGSREWEYLTWLPGPPLAATEMTLARYMRWTRQELVARLQNLTEAERTAVIVPSTHSQQPDEKWSLDQLLRQMVAHEREHITQIQAMLAAWRVHYLARLRAERAHLLWQLRGLSQETLASAEVMPDWTVKDVLTHLAYYDAFRGEQMLAVSDGRLEKLPDVSTDQMDAQNTAVLAQFQSTPPEQAVAMLLKERNGFEALLDRIPDRTLQQRMKTVTGRRTSLRVWANWRIDHDESHGRQLAAWRATLPQEQLRGQTPKYVLRAMLYASRKAFQALLSLIPEAEWTSRPVCGVWTMKDLLGHLTDWEKVAIEGMRPLVAGQTPEFELELTDFDRFNNQNAAARQEQPWAEVWADYESTRAELLDLLAQTSEANLARVFAVPWGGELPGFVWMHIWPGHELEHAIDVRQALQLHRWPRRLVHHG